MLEMKHLFSIIIASAMQKRNWIRTPYKTFIERKKAEEEIKKFKAISDRADHGISAHCIARYFLQCYIYSYVHVTWHT